MYRWLEPAKYWKKTRAGRELVSFEPTRRKLGDLIDAVAAIGHLRATGNSPAWLETDGDYPAHEAVVLRNGILHLPTRKLREHVPQLYLPHSLVFDYDRNAPAPRRWERFLRDLWGGDAESIDTLAEIMGYVLGGDTRQQKMFLMVGPKRSGKGTIARVLTGLLGQHNTTAPTLASLTTNFGLQTWSGSRLAVVSDARLGLRADGLIAVERLLSISGEDSITVDRKYRDPWTGKLDTRFLILTNEIPRFIDSSGALASRFILLQTAQSFYGREDPNLSDELLAEAPGIFNWALRGLDRLNERGHFVTPASSREAIRHLEDMASPVGAFVRDRCEVGPAFEVGKDVMFDEWKYWCEEEGRARPGTKAIFIRDLRAAVPGLGTKRLRDGASRFQAITGIRLASQSTGPPTTPDQSDRVDDTWPDQVRDTTVQSHSSRSLVRGGRASPTLWDEHTDQAANDVTDATHGDSERRFFFDGKGPI